MKRELLVSILYNRLMYISFDCTSFNIACVRNNNTINLRGHVCVHVFSSHIQFFLSCTRVQLWNPMPMIYMLLSIKICVTCLGSAITLRVHWFLLYPFMHLTNNNCEQHWLHSGEGMERSYIWFHRHGHCEISAYFSTVLSGSVAGTWTARYWVQHANHWASVPPIKVCFYLVIMLILVYIQMKIPLKVKTSKQKNVNFGQTARMEMTVLSTTPQ